MNFLHPKEVQNILTNINHLVTFFYIKMINVTLKYSKGKNSSPVEPPTLELFPIAKMVYLLSNIYVNNHVQNIVFDDKVPFCLLMMWFQLTSE